MKKLLALLLIFVSLSSLKAEPSTENPTTRKELTRESVPVPIQKQVQDVLVHSKPTWGETIEIMFDQHPIKFSAFVLLPMGNVLRSMATNKSQYIQFNKIVAIIICTLSLGYIYRNTEVPIQGTPS